jgi:hypothetical protein
MLLGYIKTSTHVKREGFASRLSDLLEDWGGAGIVRSSGRGDEETMA